MDQLRIETPEQIALELPLAGIGSRSLAAAIDTLIQIGVFIVYLIACVFLVPLLVPGAEGWVAPVLVLLGTFCLYWGYFAFFEIIWKGQTPGKRYARIRVIKESGRPIDAFEAITRNLVRVVDFLPSMYVAGIVCMLLNRRNRRLGDYAAGTVVVHERRTGEMKPYLDESSPGSELTAERARLIRDDLLLVETYLQRRHDLDPEVRFGIAREIADRIRAKAGIPDDRRQSVDEFLEAAARQIRENARY